ncbi:tetraacyldisaccharide 4'-kinase [Vibrio mexicanus]|uniref:tetraacyldisaccharide 4'-kinase n=1 Tax=Vibrio mexicanus TaxID=1004326 RepID=UPI00063C9511|nr:tetraacyldisaccharide 4'-kinase [Vibrio mexicanus]
MIEKIWFNNHPLKYLMWPLLWPLSLVFAHIARKRKAGYLAGKKTSYRASVPVIVVGNITAGGNGKTPVVIWLVEQLQALGYNPGVVSRGYGGKAPSYPLVVTNETPTDYSGDEPSLIHRRTGALVAVDPKRPAAIRALEAKGVDIIITDDGLQHYPLQRDIEIVVVDGQRRFGNQQMLPLGPLREPVSRLDSVDFIITNGGEAQEGEMAMSLTPSDPVNLHNGEKTLLSELDSLVAFAGIGHPPRFFKTLETMGAKPVYTKAFADHQAYHQNELEQLAQQGSHLIMTEKDAVKCHQFAQANWWYLPVTATFSESDTQQLLNRIKKVMEEYGSSST